ncbi:hypothetical protein JB92DRAFT_3144558 [Gautieria morchelliformis]|nr:hypothetical protein JB92DRAFT_3144558 [Gautieria morchelliformis]
MTRTSASLLTFAMLAYVAAALRTALLARGIEAASVFVGEGVIPNDCTSAAFGKGDSAFGMRAVGTERAGSGAGDTDEGMGIIRNISVGVDVDSTTRFDEPLVLRALNASKERLRFAETSFEREIPGIRIISPSDSTKSSDEGFLRSPEVGFERLSQAGSDKASLWMSNITDPNTAYLGTMNLAQAIRTNKVRGFSPSPSLQTVAPKNMPSLSVSPLKGFMQQIFTPNRKTNEDEPLPVYNGEIPRAHIHADKVTSLDMDPLSLTWLMSLTLKGVVFIRPLNLIAWCIYDDTDMKTVACMNVVELCRFMRAQSVKERKLNKGTVNTAWYFEVCVAVVEMLASQRSEYMAAITKSLKTYRSFVVVGSDSYLCEGRDRQGKNMYGEALTLYQHRAWVLNTHDAKAANVNAIKALCF